MSTRPNFCPPTDAQKVSRKRPIPSRSAERLVFTLAQISFFRKVNRSSLTAEEVKSLFLVPRKKCAARIPSRATPVAASRAAGSHRPRLHQSALADQRLGIRERRPRAEGASGRAAGFQHCVDYPRGGADRDRLGYLPGTGSGRISPMAARSACSVPAVFRLPPLLPQPPPTPPSPCWSMRCAMKAPQRVGSSGGG